MMSGQIPLQPNLVQNINFGNLMPNPPNKININLINSNNFNIPPLNNYQGYPPMHGIHPHMQYPPQFIPPYHGVGPMPSYPPNFHTMNMINIPNNNGVINSINGMNNLSPNSGGSINYQDGSYNYVNTEMRNQGNFLHYF